MGVQQCSTCSTCPGASDLSTAPTSQPQSCTHRFLQCIYQIKQIQEHCNQMNQPSELKPVKHHRNNLYQADIQKRNCKILKTGIQPHLFTCRSVFGVRAARPQSDKWGLSSSSSKIFADLKFLCTVEGRQTSCKYLREAGATV